jgi:carbonic anhydrase
MSGALAHSHDGRPGSYLQRAEKNERVVGHTDGGAIAAASEDLEARRQRARHRERGCRTRATTAHAQRSAQRRASNSGRRGNSATT